MEARYSTRSPQEEDGQAISDFVAFIFEELQGIPAAYTKSHLSPRHFQWKYLQNPIHPACVRIAEDRGQLVGIKASTFKRLKIGERDYLCAEYGDAFTHPQYRRRGIFTRLTNEVCDQLWQDGVRVIYSRPTENSYPGLVKLGYEDLLSPREMFTILNMPEVWKRKATGGLLFRLGLPLAKLAAKAVFRGARVSPPPHVTISEIPSFDEAADELWQRVCRDYPVTVVRNREYLNWRYAASPDDYVIHAARDGGLLLGYMVTKCRRLPGGLNQGHLVDILATRDQPLVLQMLLSEAMAHFKRKNMDVVFTWVLKSAEWYRVLRKAGFVSRGKGLHFVIRTNGLKASDEAQLRNPANWLFTMGDTDSI